MLKSTFFKHLATKRKETESLHQLSPPSLADANLLVKQQQPSVWDIRTPIPNNSGHFSRATEATSTLEQEDGIIHYHIGPNSATTLKRILNVPQTQSKSHQMLDPQHTSNRSLLGKVNEITLEQVNCLHQKPIHRLRTDNQHRLCYECRQKGHFTKNCPQLTTKWIFSKGNSPRHHEIL